MASTLYNILLELRGKTDTLAKKVSSISEENNQLKEENVSLKAEIKELREQLQRKSLDSEFLEVSHYIADSPDSLILARRRIANMIRTIDRCLEMLRDGRV